MTGNTPSSFSHIYLRSIPLQIETERLRIVPLTMDQLGLYADKIPQLEMELGFPISRTVITKTIQHAIEVKRSKMARTSEWNHPWYTYWLIVVKAEPFGAGLVGFKGFPTKTGEVEIGYGIDSRFQNKGYMTEAVRGMIEWAFGLPRCTAVTAQTRCSNLASQKVLEKVGMQLVNETAELLTWRIRK